MRPGGAPAHPKLRTWESNPAIGLMRPDRTPVRPQCSSTSGDGGIRTHTKRFLRPPPLPDWATSPCGMQNDEWKMQNDRGSSNFAFTLLIFHSIDPWGNRTPASAVRGRRPEPLDERAVSAPGRTRTCRVPKNTGLQSAWLTHAGRRIHSSPSLTPRRPSRRGSVPSGI